MLYIFSRKRNSNAKRYEHSHAMASQSISNNENVQSMQPDGDQGLNTGGEINVIIIKNISGIQNLLNIHSQEKINRPISA